MIDALDVHGIRNDFGVLIDVNNVRFADLQIEIIRARARVPSVVVKRSRRTVERNGNDVVRRDRNVRKFELLIINAGIELHLVLVRADLQNRLVFDGLHVFNRVNLVFRSVQIDIVNARFPNRLAVVRIRNARTVKYESDIGETTDFEILENELFDLRLCVQGHRGFDAVDHNGRFILRGGLAALSAVTTFAAVSAVCNDFNGDRSGLGFSVHNEGNRNDLIARRAAIESTDADVVNIFRRAVRIRNGDRYFARGDRGTDRFLTAGVIRNDTGDRCGLASAVAALIVRNDFYGNIRGFRSSVHRKGDRNVLITDGRVIEPADRNAVRNALRGAVAVSDRNGNFARGDRFADLLCAARVNRRDAGNRRGLTSAVATFATFAAVSTVAAVRNDVHVKGCGELLTVQRKGNGDRLRACGRGIESAERDPRRALGRSVTVIEDDRNVVCGERGTDRFVATVINRFNAG